MMIRKFRKSAHYLQIRNSAKCCNQLSQGRFHQSTRRYQTSCRLSCPEYWLVNSQQRMLPLTCKRKLRKQWQNNRSNSTAEGKEGIDFSLAFFILEGARSKLGLLPRTVRCKGGSK